MKVFKFKYLLKAWWLFAIMVAIALGPSIAYAAEITMGSGGNLIFEPNEITISFEVTFPESGDYEFQCDPHAGAGMKGVIHVE